MPLPAEFLERLATILPADKFEACLVGFDHDFPAVFWLNTLLAKPENILQQLKAESFNYQPVGVLPHAYYLPATEKRRLISSGVYQRGEVYLQNLASMLPVMVLQPQPGETILDLTAAPGSKTIQMAVAMQNCGRIIAVEKVKKRFFHLQANLKEHGITNVETLLADGKIIWKKYPEQFNKILLDAPCSSEARFKSFDVKTYQYWSTKKISEMQRKQKQLLFSAISCLQPGGTLIYSTCSFAPEENEAVVNRVLKKYPNTLDVAPINCLNDLDTMPGLLRYKKQKYGSRLINARRILPSILTQGFFICKIIKKGQ